jgi:L-rhamnose mutarotase
MNRYIMIYELKPEHVDDYRKMHKTAHLTEFKDQLDAIRDSNCQQMMTFLYKNWSILYVETDEEIDALFTKLGEFEANSKWQKVTAPWFATTPSFDGSAKSEPIEKIFDLQQQLKGELKPF